MRVASEPLISATSPGASRSSTARCRILSGVGCDDLIGGHARRARRVGDATRAITLGYQQVQDTGGPIAHPFVPVRFVVPQLEHVAQDRDAVAGVQCGYGFERGFDRSRAGAVRIIQEQTAATAGERIEPARHPWHLGQSAGDGVKPDPPRQAHGDRGQRGIHLVPAQEGDVDLAAAGRGVHREARTFA